MFVGDTGVCDSRSLLGDIVDADVREAVVDESRSFDVGASLVAVRPPDRFSCTSNVSEVFYTTMSPSCVPVNGFVLNSTGS